MDSEDRLFVKVVGGKAARTLKTRNIRLWNAFRERCQENGEKPENVLGRLLLKFVNSVLDGDEFHEDLLDVTINVSALAKKKDLKENLAELLEIKRALSQTESDEIDRLIQKLIVKEIERASSSPIDVLAQQQQPQQQIVIDENLLYSLDTQSLDMLAKMVEKVKKEKELAQKVTSEQIEQVVKKEGEELEEEVEEVEESKGMEVEEDEGEEEVE